MSGAYYRANFDHMVILADRLNRADGLALEQALQSACKFGKARGEPYRRKYHEDHRNDVYRGSVGNGSMIDPLAKLHSVYMAWVDR